MGVPVGETDYLFFCGAFRGGDGDGGVHPDFFIEKAGERRCCDVFGDSAFVEIVVLGPEIPPGGFVGFLEGPDLD